MNRKRLATILDAFKGVRIAVCGDFFLDRYLWIDPARAEISVETGLVAHQVTHQTSAPGAAGTVAANLAALGAHVVCLGVVGDDGDGYMLRQGLHAIGADENLMILTPERPTATYTKPVIRQPDNTVVERERLDIRSREPLPSRYTMQLADHLETLAPRIDAIVYADQMPEHGAGVVDAPRAAPGRHTERSADAARRLPRGFHLRTRGEPPRRRRCARRLVHPLALTARPRRQQPRDPRG